MPYAYNPKTNLSKREYHPDENPLLNGFEISTKTKKLVKTKLQTPATNTGEIHSSNVFVTKELDEAQFVKVFSEGIKASFDLTKTAHRVFQSILDEYEKVPMRKGYVDTLQLEWFDGGISGHKVGMHRRTFNRGLAELLDKGFLAAKTPSTYWVNPALFFKGDRVRFVNEYKKKRSNKIEELTKESLSPDQTDREKLEAMGQTRID